MKAILIILVLLGAAWSIPEVRSRTYEPAFKRLGPTGEKLLAPTYRAGARSQANHMFRIMSLDRDQGRPLPEPQTFQRWIRSRLGEEATLDPWGSPYYMERERSMITIGSPGPDRRRGTDDDIRVTQAAP
jgi:hypothetical protein